MSTEHISTTPEQYLCCYVNTTSRIQIGKIHSSKNSCNTERVIFPGEKFLFETPESSIAIYTELVGKTILLDTISCSHLQAHN